MNAVGMKFLVKFSISRYVQNCFKSSKFKNRCLNISM